MPEKLKLPPGYRIDEKYGYNIIVLYYLNEIVDEYTQYATEKNIILDAIKHSEQREKSEE
jgi:hypothetical protein